MSLLFKIIFVLGAKWFLCGDCHEILFVTNYDVSLAMKWNIESIDLSLRSLSRGPKKTSLVSRRFWARAGSHLFPRATWWQSSLHLCWKFRSQITSPLASRSTIAAGSGDGNVTKQPRPQQQQEERTAVYINNIIMKMKEPADLVASYRRNGLRSFSAINVATTVHRLAKLARAADTEGGGHPLSVATKRAATARAAAAIAANAEVEDNVTSSKAGRGALVGEVRKAWRALGQRTLNVSDQFEMQGLSNLLWGLAVLRAPPAPRLRQALLSQLRKLTPRLRPQAVSNTLWALATLECEPNAAVLAALSRRAVETARDFEPQAVANTLSALAMLKCGAGPALLAAMSRRAVERAGDFKPQEVANTLCALAKMGVSVNSALMVMVAVLSRRAIETVGSFKPQAVANTLWALASLECVADVALVTALSQRALATAGDFIPQNLADTLWALAALGRGADSLLVTALSRRAVAMAGSFKPQNVADTLWALATLEGDADPLLVAALSRRALKTSGDFMPQDVARTLWALAALGRGADSLLVAALSQRAVAMAGNFKPRNVADTLWALSTLEIDADPLLVTALSRRAIETSRVFMPPDVANTLWALAFLNTHPGLQAIEALTARASASSPAWCAEDLSKMLWALAALGEGGRQLDPGLVLRLAKVFRAGASSAAATAAVGVVGVRRQRNAGVFGEQEMAAFDARHALALAQLHQVFVFRDLEGAFQALGGPEFAKLRARSCRAFEAVRNVTLSQFQSLFAWLVLKRVVQAEVSNVADELGWDFKEEVVDPVTGYALDILVHDSAPPPNPEPGTATSDSGRASTSDISRRGLGGRQALGLGCVVHADAPSHFLMPVYLDPRAAPPSAGDVRSVLSAVAPGEEAVCVPWRANGATELKRRLLQRAGYRVASVAFWEWDQAASGPARRALLTRIVAAAGAIPVLRSSVPESK